MQNIYFQLTQEFTQGRPRAVMSGGQAVVWHRLAIMTAAAASSLPCHVPGGLSWTA